MQTRYVVWLGMALFVVGGASFLLLTGWEATQRYPILQYLNLVAWMVALIGLFSMAVGVVVHLLRRTGILA